MNILLIDFGSTYTKITAVDLEKEEVIGTANSFTTAGTDINEGFLNALEKLKRQTGDISFTEKLACSSAAGGLRMAASGLVPELTTKAAKTASLGAGAKLIKAYSYELTDEDIEEIGRSAPDIFLLTGGIDGGNFENIIFNSKMLSRCKKTFPVILAGNRNAAAKCREHLKGREVYVAENVMPKFNELNILPVQKLIRDIFLKRIIEAKGLSKVMGIVNGIMMPTPAALLKSLELLANGTKNVKGIGELFAVDIGGATTDVYSIAKGDPLKANTVMRGLPEPYAKRTVEGDIGMRYNIAGILEAAGIERIAELAEISEEKVAAFAEKFAKNTQLLPQNDEEKAFEYALGSAAVETASIRHAGQIEMIFTPMGETYLQTGKDLSGVSRVIATGGAVINADDPVRICRHAMFSPKEQMSLRPVNAEIVIDKRYIMSAMGVLSEKHPDTALKILKKELGYGA